MVFPEEKRDGEMRGQAVNGGPTVADKQVVGYGKLE